MSELKHDQYPYLPRGKASLLIQIACFMSRNRKQMLLKIKKNQAFSLKIKMENLVQNSLLILTLWLGFLLYA